jgi:hypothetical protein
MMLYLGAVLAAAVACGFTWYNVLQASDWKGLVGGASIAFICGLVAIGSDLQGSVRSRLGALANTSIWQCPMGLACLLGWSAFGVVMYQIAQLYPDWASQTFHFKIGKNLLVTGFAVGVSAIIIIRSKLTKVNDVEWGAEWIYLWSGAQVLDAVNRRRVSIKKALETKVAPYATDLTGQQLFFTDLEAHVKSLLPGLPIDLQNAVNKEIQQLRNNSVAPPGAVDADAQVNGNVNARRFLVSIVIDYLGDRDIKIWAGSKGLAI